MSPYDPLGQGTEMNWIIGIYNWLNRPSCPRTTHWVKGPKWTELIGIYNWLKPTFERDSAWLYMNKTISRKSLDDNTSIMIYVAEQSSRIAFGN